MRFEYMQLAWLCTWGCYGNLYGPCVRIWLCESVACFSPRFEALEKFIEVDCNKQGDDINENIVACKGKPHNLKGKKQPSPLKEPGCRTCFINSDWGVIAPQSTKPYKNG